MTRTRRRLLVAAAAATLSVVAAGSALAASRVAPPLSFPGGDVVRAELVVVDRSGTVHDYRVDRGKVVSASPSSLVLAERDGTTVTVPLAANVAVTLNRTAATVADLVKGMEATATRDGDSPAATVEATGRRAVPPPDAGKRASGGGSEDSKRPRQPRR